MGQEQEFEVHIKNTWEENYILSVLENNSNRSLNNKYGKQADTKWQKLLHPN
jgi:hypothetical protein